MKMSLHIIDAPPSAPTNLSTTQLSNGQYTTTVNLTWSQSDSCYVQMYYVEVTATNINFTNMTTSQNVTLMLQIGIVYSFRVRGADTISRLGEWSDSFIYPGKHSANTCKCMISLHVIDAPPLAPTNLSTARLNKGQPTTVNLTWSQSDSCYVKMYYVEVTATNINFTNMTTSQNITLMLQIGLLYSFRVRAVDTINRQGEWSGYIKYSKSISYKNIKGLGFSIEIKRMYMYMYRDVEIYHWSTMVPYRDPDVTSLVKLSKYHCYACNWAIDMIQSF